MSNYVVKPILTTIIQAPNQLIHLNIKFCNFSILSICVRYEHLIIEFQCKYCSFPKFSFPIHQHINTRNLIISLNNLMIHINCSIRIPPYDPISPHFFGVEQTLMHFYRHKSKSMMGYIIHTNNKTLRYLSYFII
jgi:hypothetical protein